MLFESRKIFLQPFLLEFKEGEQFERMWSENHHSPYSLIAVVVSAVWTYVLNGISIFWSFGL